MKVIRRVKAIDLSALISMAFTMLAHSQLDLSPKGTEAYISSVVVLASCAIVTVFTIIIALTSTER